MGDTVSIGEPGDVKTAWVYDQFAKRHKVNPRMLIKLPEESPAREDHQRYPPTDPGDVNLAPLLKQLFFFP